MTTLNTYFTVALLGCATLVAEAQSGEKLLVKSFNLQGQETVLLDLEGEIDVQTWKSDIMRVQMSIMLPSGNNTILKSLIKAGRYQLRSKIDDGEFLVFAPNLQREVSIKGEPLNEVISYTIFAPENIVVKMADEASTSHTTTPNSSSSL